MNKLCFVTIAAGFDEEEEGTSHFGLENGSRSSVWTKIGIDMLLDNNNKLIVTESFLDGSLWSKVQYQPILTPQITFQLGIPSIQFGQNLALIS